MKKILIIADGILAKHFLQRVMDIGLGENSYYIVTYDDRTLPDKESENCKFFDFDPTSFEKLSLLLVEDFYEVMIIVSSKIDAVGSYENIRKIKKDIQIVMVDRWGLEYEDRRLYLLDSREVLASRFADYLPDMPVIAQNVGLGKGEIMEIRVPIGSSFVYRHLASIEQNNWRIAAIYRANKLILPRDSLMILPNDVMLSIGDPNVLKSVFSSVKQEIGQFPLPFGQVIYCHIDMLVMDENRIEMLLNDAMLLHSKINSKRLHIKVINPTYSKMYEKIKSYANSKYISVDIDFYEQDTQRSIKKDAKVLNIGLVVVDYDFFKKYKSTLFEIKKPVFKMGVWGFLELKDAVVLSSDNDDIEKESSVIFDFSIQLDLSIKLYDFNPEIVDDEENDLVEHFENLSKLFSKKVEVIKPKSNPIIKLRHEKNILQFVPFSEKVVNSNIFSIFSTDMEKLYFKLAQSYQLFIPVVAEEQE